MGASAGAERAQTHQKGRGGAGSGRRDWTSGQGADHRALVRHWTTSHGSWKAIRWWGKGERLTWPLEKNSFLGIRVKRASAGQEAAAGIQTTVAQVTVR